MRLRSEQVDAALVAAIAAGVAILAVHRGHFALSDDDYARVVIAQRFARAPSLDPSGTSWLPFPFWLTGTAMSLTVRALLVARIIAVASFAAAGVLVHRAGRLLGLTAPRALGAAALAVLLPTASRLGASFQPEALTAGLVVFGAATTQVDGRYRVLGGAALALATLSRYEAWPVAAGFALFCALDLQRGRPLAAPAGALAVAGPVAWILHGALRHGDPLFFVRRVTAYRRALGVHESVLRSLLAYPHAALRAEPELCALAALAALFWLFRAVRPPAARRFAVVMGALLGFLVVSRLLDGAPTHHDERPLLPIFWGVVLVVWGIVPEALSALGSRTKVRESWFPVLMLVGTCGAVVRYGQPADPGAPRVEERTMGTFARKMAPGAFLVVDTPDYGYFAVIAAFESPERAAPFARHDPRERGKTRDLSALSTPELAAAFRATCAPTAPGTDCAYVVHASHREIIPLLGASGVSEGPFTLVRAAR